MRMLPVLLSIGPFKLYSFTAFIILAWATFSFLFWRYLRSLAIEDEKIFDTMFWMTWVTFICSRIGYILFHIDIFNKNWLTAVVFWVQPGLTLFGALCGIGLTLIAFSVRKKIRLAYLADAFTLAFPFSFIIGSLGTLLDGSVVGNTVNVPWAVHYVGFAGRRHPVQLYETGIMVVVLFIIFFIKQKADRKKWPYGVITMWFFMLLPPAMFALEFVKETDVYWLSLSANQWLYIGIFAEAVGAFYVRGGGKEKIRYFLKGLYAEFSNRYFKRNT